MLRRYVVQTVFLAMLAGVGGLLCLQTVLAYLSELDVAKELTAIQVFWYIVYRLPYFLLQILPTGVLLGAVVGLGVLSANSELVVMQSCGISRKRIVAWAMIPAWAFVLVALAVNQWVLPISSVYAKGIYTKQTFDPSTVATLHGYWTVVPTQGGREIVHIGSADSDGNLQDVRRYVLAGDTLVSALSATAGSWQDGYAWRLYDADEVRFYQGATTVHYSSLVSQLPIAKKSIHLLTKNADELSISELVAHKQLMVHQGNRSKRHELALWKKLLSPLSLVSLLLLACSFVFGSLRLHSLGFRVVVALLVGLLFNYLQDVSGFIALVGNMPVVVMVLLPILLSGGVGLWLLGKRQ